MAHPERPNGEIVDLETFRTFVHDFIRHVQLNPGQQRYIQHYADDQYENLALARELVTTTPLAVDPEKTVTIEDIAWEALSPDFQKLFHFLYGAAEQPDRKYIDASLDFAEIDFELKSRHIRGTIDIPTETITFGGIRLLLEPDPHLVADPGDFIFEKSPYGLSQRQLKAEDKLEQGEQLTESETEALAQLPVLTYRLPASLADLQAIAKLLRQHTSQAHCTIYY